MEKTAGRGEAQSAVLLGAEGSHGDPNAEEPTDVRGASHLRKAAQRSPISAARRRRNATDLGALRIWLDADATPRDVKDIVFRAAHRLALDAIVVANQRVPIPPGHPTISAVRVEGGPDVADRYIATNASAGDVAITADIPLAAILVAANVVVIDPRGFEHTTETIGERLSVRDFADGLRSAGIETGGPRPYTAKDKQAFASAFDRAITRALRSRLI